VIDTAGLTLSPLTVTLVVAVFIPIVVGLLTKAGASSWVKGLVNIFTAGVVALVTANLDANGAAVLTQSTLQNWIIATIVSTATYLGIYQSVGLNGKTAPTKGIG
jgi:hypothetical protein